MKISRFISSVLQLLAALTCACAYDLFRGIKLPMAALTFGLTETADDKILKAIGDLGENLKKIGTLENEFKLVKDETQKTQTALNDVQKQILDFSKQRVQASTQRRQRLHMGLIDDDCAMHLAAVYMLGCLKQQDEVKISKAALDMYKAEVKNLLGVEFKASLTTSDIPLPIQYSGDIVELVYKYGQARLYGTVFPLGAGTVKLPKLTTDPTFGLIAQSASITEKSPQAGFVSFNAEKFGGMIRLPSEIEEDSIIAMGQFIARYAARNMALCEDWQFFRSTGADTGINGAGVGLTQSVVNDGIIITQATGNTAQNKATLQNFRDLRGTSGLSGAVLGQAAYYVHPTYEALFATFNTSATVTPYQRNAPGGPTLDGFPIRWVSVMPALSSTASASLCHALFGDASFNYLGIRGAFRFDTSREAAFTTDEILIRAIERMTVGKMATLSMAGLVNAAS